MHESFTGSCLWTSIRDHGRNTYASYMVGRKNRYCEIYSQLAQEITGVQGYTHDSWLHPWIRTYLAFYTLVVLDYLF